MTRLTLSFWIGFLLLSTAVKAEITSTQRTELASVQKLVKQAAALYVEGKKDGVSHPQRQAGQFREGGIDVHEIDQYRTSLPHRRIKCASHVSHARATG